MAKLIEIIGEQNIPKIVCPHCKKEIPIGLDEWKKDVTRIMADKCPSCGGTTFFALLILAHKDLNSLGITVNAAVNAVNSQNLILGGKRQGV